ncbi:hypothetical protein VME0621_04678 [Vibrio mediterranei]|uniref:hypothetical protein n=1 Tax=Vibrio mediterranei TaxID=689 RepID=UPI000784C49C|nr:hypothetical protein [Vibrio mediterranei]SBO12524.1 hypothetical protein VME0621_04678 [Vibrio mediterranei]
MKVFTTTDVIQRVADGRLVMSDLPSRRLNPRQVVIEVNNKARVDVLSAPARYADDALVDILLDSFTQSEYAVRLGISQKSHRNAAVRAFFAFLNTKDYPITTEDEDGNSVAVPLPAHCFSDWLDHLKANETPYNVWSRMSELRKVLLRALEKRFGNQRSTWPTTLKAAWQMLDASTPVTPKYTKSPPLGPYLGIPPDQFSNNELKNGLRYGVIWLLKRLQAQREAFVAKPAIQHALDELQGSTPAQFAQAFSWLDNFLVGREPSQERPHNPERLSRVAPVAWQVIQADPLLTEWQCYCFAKLRPALVPGANGEAHPITPETQQTLLARCVNPDGSLRARPKGHGQNDTGWAPLKPWLGGAGNVTTPQRCRWGRDWLVHSELEQLLMVWLLASERAQTSGIKLLTFDGVWVARRELQISTIKLRRASSPSAKPHSTDVHTEIYRQHEPPFGVYHTWLQQTRKAQAALDGLNPDNRYMYGSAAQLSGTIATNTAHALTAAVLPLELLSVQGTVWHDTFIAETGNSREAQAFIAILAKCVAKKRANPSAKVTLPVGPIGQSLVVEQELESNWDDTHSEIENEVMGHDKSTGRNVYKDGFRRAGVSEILAPVQAFARKVGDDKIELAQQIARHLNEQSRPVSLAELEKLCDIDTARTTQRDLLATLSAQDKISITGEIGLGDQLLIVQTDLTAAMMWGYIQHLEASLPELMGTDRDETTLRHLAQYLHLTDTFTRLDNGLQQEGKRLAKEMQFPFPPLN